MIYRAAGQQTVNRPGWADPEVGEPWVSSVVIAEDERDEYLAFDVAMHLWAGWTVTANESTRVVVARKTRDDGSTVVRILWFEASDPALDGIEVGS